MDRCIKCGGRGEVYEDFLGGDEPSAFDYGTITQMIGHILHSEYDSNPDCRIGQIWIELDRTCWKIIAAHDGQNTWYAEDDA